MKANNRGKWSQSEGRKASKAALIQVEKKSEGKRTQVGTEYTKTSTKKV